MITNTNLSLKQKYSSISAGTKNPPPVSKSGWYGQAPPNNTAFETADPGKNPSPD